MSAFDENSYNVNSYNVRSYWFSDLVTNLWNPVIQFKLKVATKLNLTLRMNR